MHCTNLNDLMCLYALKGVNEWADASTSLRQRALRCLSTAIADGEHEARRSIHTTYKLETANCLKFIPMPKHRSKGIERSFFLPIRERIGDKEKISFDLFLLVARTDCIAFRIEPADKSGWAHSYGHVQLSKRMLRKTIKPTGIPDFLPDSYPAFPLPASDPLKLFLSMAIAIHGYSGGLEDIIQEIFQKASRPQDARVYLKELHEMLK